MSDHLLLIEMIVVFGAALAFAVYELVRTRRALRRDRRNDPP